MLGYKCSPKKTHSEIYIRAINLKYAFLENKAISIPLRNIIIILWDFSSR